MPSITEAKEQYAERLNRLIETYDKIIFCNIDNVKSQQLHDVRASLRGKSEVLVGKKTLQKRIISNRAEAEGASESDKALAEYLCGEKEMLVGNLALVFTNLDVGDIKENMTKHRVQAPARINTISPVEVIVPAGNTGLEPTMTNFFQALNIATKIAKGTVEIVSEKKVLNIGDKVDASTASLLGKLKISPFYYQPEIEFFFEKGMMFTAEDMSVTDDVIAGAMAEGITNVTALSLGSGVLTDLSFPHAITDGFKDLLALCVATDYTFSEYDGKTTIENIKSGKCVGGGGGGAPAAAAAAAPAAAAPASKAAPHESSTDDDEEMNLF